MTRSIWLLLAFGVWAASHTGWAQQTRGVPSPSALPQPAAGSQPALPTPSLLPEVQSGTSQLPPTPPAPLNAAPPQPAPATSPQTPSLSPSGTGQGTSGGYYGAGRASATNAPPSGSSAMPYFNPFANAQGFINRPAATIGGNTRGAPLAKPHANYTPPPAISPYMNLFRNDDNNGMVNNYYSLVRPELEQRAYNQQAERQIQSVQAAARLQSQQINQLNLRTTTPQPGQFLNSQPYSPGHRSPGR